MATFFGTMKAWNINNILFLTKYFLLELEIMLWIFVGGNIDKNFFIILENKAPLWSEIFPIYNFLAWKIKI